MEQHRRSAAPSLASRAGLAAGAHLIGAVQILCACILTVINRQTATKRRVAAVACLAMLLLVAAFPALAEPTAEVLHWWTSGGEARALKVIADRFTESGGRWIDSPIAGGGGDAARTVAKTRMIGGKPPTIMQWHLGLSLRQLADSGLLGEVDAVARDGNWDKVLPPLLAANAKIGGRY